MRAANLLLPLALASLTACVRVEAPRAAPGAKGYVVAEIDVTDPALFESYKAKSAAAVARAGGRFLVRGGAVESIEGAAPHGRIVVAEFPSAAAASAFLRSPDYAEAAAIRHRAARSRVYVVEGVRP